MEPSRHRRIKELFTQARERTPGEREAFLSQACGDDAELRREVEQLLASDERATGTPLARALNPDEPTQKAPPKQIGPYELRELLGEGGMGEVYLAYQKEPIERSVALKIIRPGLENKSVLGRFESERKALAMMDHRNIARALDAGTMEDGRPYFVMEYVDGIPLTEYCDRESLPTRARLELLAQVCDGLHHAHQKAIIHRDVKANNVLVAVKDGTPVPKIIDFGIAKATAEPLTERTLFTEMGQVVGTPEYMSPEQALLTGDNVDTRTDIYSFGVLMYEVLVGVLPFEPEALRRAGFEEILRRIREEDPPRPSTRLGMLRETPTKAFENRSTTAHRLSSELRGDLDWITMKALEKDPARRYRSATELADDIRRYLKFEPVSAGPPSASYRLAKFARRHRVGVAFGALSMVFLVVFLITTIWQAQVIAGERDRASAEAQAARELAGFLKGLFERADPGRTKGAEVTAEEILAAGAREIDRLDGEPLTQAAFMETIGGVYGVMGLFNEGRTLLERAVAIREDAGADDETAELALAGSLFELGTLLIRARQPDAGLPLVERAAEIQERLAAEELALAATLNSVGNGLKESGRLPEAEAAHRRALAIREKYPSAGDAGLSASLHNVGSLRFVQGDLEEAEELYRRSIDVAREHEGEMDYGLGTTQHTLAMVYTVQGRYEEALPLEESSLAIREQVLGAEHPHVGISLRTLAEILTAVGQGERAVPLAARAAQIGLASWGPEVPDVWWMERGHAEVLNAVGRSEEALAVMEPLVARVEAAPRRVEYSLHLAELGNCYRGLGRFDEARARYEQAVAVGVEEDGDDSPYTAELRLGLARLLRDAGQTDEARALYEAALEVLERERGTSDPYYVRGKDELDALP